MVSKRVMVKNTGGAKQPFEIMAALPQMGPSPVALGVDDQLYPLVKQLTDPESVGRRVAL